MKSLIAGILLISSVSFAEVDYIGFGQSLESARYQLQTAKDLVTCGVASYQQSPSCYTIVVLHKALNNLSNENTYAYASLGNLGCVNEGASLYQLRDKNLEELQVLLDDAGSDDPAVKLYLDLVNNVEAYKVELLKTRQSLDLQAAYKAQCLK